MEGAFSEADTGMKEAKTSRLRLAQNVYRGFAATIAPDIVSIHASEDSKKTFVKRATTRHECCAFLREVQASLYLHAHIGTIGGFFNRRKIVICR